MQWPAAAAAPHHCVPGVQAGGRRRQLHLNLPCGKILHVRRLVGGLALLTLLSGCADGQVASSTATGLSTTSSATTAAISTTAPPVTSTTIAYGSRFVIRSVESTISTEGLQVWVRHPRLTGFHRDPSEAHINAAIEAFVDGRTRTYLPRPDGKEPPAEYCLDFEVLWSGEEAWSLLPITFTEVRFAGDATSPTTDRFAFIFDLVTGDSLTPVDLLTPQGVESLQTLVGGRVAGVIGEVSCCFRPGGLIGQMGLVPEGLLVYVDESDGVPQEAGPLEFLFTWEEVAPLIDPRHRYLARFAVEAGFCSTSGEDLVLEDQPGLPAPVAATKKAIFAAAVSCDYAALGALAGLDLPGSSWGGVLSCGGTAEDWRWQEASGNGTLWRLTRTLNLPPAPMRYETPGETGTFERQGYVWPDLFTVDWSSISAEERAELVEVYGEESVAHYEDLGGYMDMRLGILNDGTWAYCAEGD